MPLQLDTARRDRLVAALRQALADACPGSSVALGGSLGRGEADAYSDVDLVWTVPAAAVVAACEAAVGVLAAVGAAAAAGDLVDLRATPSDAALSRRVVARFADLPLFWGVDLQIQAAAGQAATAAPDAAGHAGGPAPADPIGDSHTHDALRCAVAAIKAFLRGRPEEGALQVSRGFEAIHIPVPGVPPRQQILSLAETVYDADDTHAPLAAAVRQLYHDAFDEG